MLLMLLRRTRKTGKFSYLCMFFFLGAESEYDVIVGVRKIPKIVLLIKIISPKGWRIFKWTTSKLT